MNAERNPELHSRWMLRCPACHARMYEVVVSPLGWNIQLEGTCPRCRTRIFAIRREAAARPSDLAKKQRLVDWLDQAA